MGSELSGSEPIALTSTTAFEQCFPVYLALGMPSHEYWEGDASLVKAYREADKLRQERQNAQAWLQGMYVYEAIGCIAPVLNAFAANGTRPKPYRDKPYDLNGSEKTKEQQMRDGISFVRAWAEGFNQKFDERGGGTVGN